MRSKPLEYLLNVHKVFYLFTPSKQIVDEKYFL